MRGDTALWAVSGFSILGVPGLCKGVARHEVGRGSETETERDSELNIVRNGMRNLSILLSLSSFFLKMYLWVCSHKEDHTKYCTKRANQLTYFSKLLSINIYCASAFGQTLCWVKEIQILTLRHGNLPSAQLHDLEYSAYIKFNYCLFPQKGSLSCVCILIHQVTQVRSHTLFGAIHRNLR